MPFSGSLLSIQDEVLYTMEQQILGNDIKYTVMDFLLNQRM